MTLFLATGIELAIAGAIAGGLLFAASLFLRPRADQRDSLGEDTPTSVSTRGEYIPYYFGTRITEDVLIGWAGNRFTRRETVGGGGGKKGGGGGGSIKQTIFFEEVWHQLGVGPATALFEIRFDGKTIYSDTILAEDTPNGTLIEAGEKGAFRIYWGDDNQPINEFLGDDSRVGVTSRWPRLCYVVWERMRYGTSPTQPQVQYIMKWGNPLVTLANSSFEIDTTGEGGSNINGVNPAHVMNALLSDTKYIGSAVPPSNIDNTTLEQWGVDAEAEMLATNIAYTGGKESKAAVAELIQDMGYQMPLVDTRIAFLPQRFSQEQIPVLTDDVIAPPDADRTIDVSPQRITRPVFTFQNEEGFSFRQQDIPFNDDGDATQFGLANAERVPINTVTNPQVASIVARRRWQESTLSSNIKLKGLRGSRLLVAGQAIKRPGLGQLRIIGTKWSGETPITELTCSLDSYAVPDINDTLDIPIPNTGTLLPEEDQDFRFIQIPPEQQTTDALKIGVLRLRAHRQITTARVNLSVNGDNYFNAGDQTHAQGGILESDIPANTLDTIPTGTLFEATSFEIDGVLDLTSNTSAWAAGAQLAVINGEVFYLVAIEAVSTPEWSPGTNYSEGDSVIPRNSTGPISIRWTAVNAGTSASIEPEWPSDPEPRVTTVQSTETVMNQITWEARRPQYKMLTLIRAQAGTEKQAHNSGDTVYITESSEITPHSIEGMIPGATLYLKSQPVTTSGQVDISNITPFSDVLEGDINTGESARVTIGDGGPRITVTGNPRVALVLQ